ncbi:MAG: hypothetical protein ACFCVH_10235 [Alphaproteobacteria bacterium]
MLPLLYPFVALVAIGTALAGLTIWSRRLLAAKIGAIALTVALFGTGYATAVELLGRPKPIGIEWAGHDLAEARVIAAEMREDVAIYLWLGVDGVEAPVSYVMPWSMEAAQQLNGAMAEAAEEGGDVQMRDPFNATPSDEEPMFYATPEAPLPPKA